MDYDEEAYPNEWLMWEANFQRALFGKRGRRALEDLREALLALPEPRLIAGAMCTVGVTPEATPGDATDLFPQQWKPLDHLLAEQGEGVCAVGAYIWHQHVKAGALPKDAFAALPLLPDYDSDLSETRDEGVAAGLTGVLAYELAMLNDEAYGRLSPEERHARFLKWIDAKLSVEVRA